MTESSLLNWIQLTIVLVFILQLFYNLPAQSNQLNEQAHYSLLPIEKEFEPNGKQYNHLNRKKRGSSLVDYLANRRKQRNKTAVLGFEMKNWLNIEISNKANLDNKAKNAKSEDIGPEYVGSEEKPIEFDTEATPTTTVSPDKKKNQTIVYKDKEFIALCKDPIFTSADCSLDGTEVLIFKGDKFYVMEDLRYGSGNLVASGLTKDLLPYFDSKGFMSMMTIKEGQMRGYTFAFYNNNERSGWGPTGYTKVKHTNEFKKKADTNLPKTGFDTVIHNRDLVNPLVIGLKGKTVYYYKTENKSFKKVKELNNEETDEKFPSDLTGGFVMSNGYIYMFQGRKYCVRELYNFEPQKPGVFCDLWMNNKIFLGCYGQYPPPYSLEDDIENFSSLKLENEQDDKEKAQFCFNLKTLKFELSVDGLTILAFNVDKYWTVEHFLEKPKIRERQSAQEKWKGFISNPDTIMIVPEGQHLRGNMFEFKNGKYNVWAPNATNLGMNIKIERFDAIIHNSDILNPMAVAFNQKSVYYYNTDSTTLRLNKTVDYSKTDENWPKGITTGLTIKTDQIYLFRGDQTYCLREWKCTDKKTNCCKKWLNAHKLFHCP